MPEPIHPSEEAVKAGTETLLLVSRARFVFEHDPSSLESEAEISEALAKAVLAAALPVERERWERERPPTVLESFEEDPQTRKWRIVADQLAKAGEYALTWFQAGYPSSQYVDVNLREALDTYRQAKEGPDA